MSRKLEVKNTSLRSVCLASGLAFCVYINTFNAGFAYDDNRAILTNSDLLPSSSWLQLFKNDFWGTPLKHSGSHKSYRPLCVLSFRLNYHINGLHPGGYHVFNVLLHTLVTAVFTFFCIKLTKDLTIALAAGVLFAVHPIHTEAVAGVVGRADSGAALFFMLSIILYQDVYKRDDSGKMRNHWPTMLMSTILCGMSMFTKEIGVTVVMVCAVFDLLVIAKFQIFNVKESLSKAYRTGTITRICFLGLSGFIWLYLRLVIMGNSPPAFAPSDNPAANDQDVLTRLLTFLYLPVFNFSLLLYPVQLSFDWSMDSVPLLRDLFDTRNAITASFYTVYGLSVLYCQRVSESKLKGSDEGASDPLHTKPTLHDTRRIKPASTDRVCSYRTDLTSSITESNNNTTHDDLLLGGFHHLVVFCIAWITLTFLPATNLFFYVGFVVAERILYIPSMGYCLLLAIGFVSFYRSITSKEAKQILLICFVALVTLFSVRTILRNQDWQNEESLYRSGIQVNPPKAWGNLANILVKQDKIADAEEAYRAALRFRPNMADTHYNLGILLQQKKRYNDAATSYKDAIKFRPKLAAAHLNLGILYSEIGDHQSALKVLQNAQNISDHGLKDPRAHQQSLTAIRYNIGKILFEAQKYQEALIAFNDALVIMPEGYGGHSLYNMMGQTLSSVGRHQEAESWYKKALKEKPDHTPAHLTLAKHLHAMGKSKEAEVWFQRAFNNKPIIRDAYIHYGQFLITTGRQHKALELIKNAVKENPHDAELVYFAGGIFREQNENAQAEVYYRKAVMLNPNELSYLMNLGALLHLQKKWDEAEKIYMQILQRNPKEEVTLKNLQKLRISRRKMGQ